MTGRPAPACAAQAGTSPRAGGRGAAMGERPDLEPTGDPTSPGRRPYTVHVSEAIEYQGWVLATGVDDADHQARRLLDDGASATGRGHLDIVGFDREVIANDAAEVCWQCRSDPRHPNPACPHPPPAKEQPPVSATEHTRIDPIRRVLDLSTTHLPEHLGSHGLSGEDGVTAYDLDGYAWLMWLPPGRHTAGEMRWGGRGSSALLGQGGVAVGGEREAYPGWPGVPQFGEPQLVGVRVGTGGVPGGQQSHRHDGNLVPGVDVRGGF